MEVVVRMNRGAGTVRIVEMWNGAVLIFWVVSCALASTREKCGAKKDQDTKLMTVEGWIVTREYDAVVESMARIRSVGAAAAACDLK